jgi:RNA polymerase-binding transcription factor DksA
MSNFELYAAIYFGLGLVVSLIVVAAHLANKRKESKFSRDIMKALNPKREAFLYRVLEDVIVPTLAFFLVWLVWPVVFVLKFKDIFKKKSQAVEADSDSDLIPHRNRNRNSNSNSNPNPDSDDPEELAFALNDFELTRQVTIEEVERTNLIQDPMEAVPNIPFGHCNARWVVFKDSLQDNETLWEFESTRSELKGVQAMWGYAVKRDGRVDRFMTSGWKLKIGVFE